MGRSGLVAAGLVVLGLASGSLSAASAAPARAAAAVATVVTPSPSPTHKATVKPKRKVTKKVTKKPTVKASPSAMMTALPMVGDYTIVASAKRVPMPAWSGPDMQTGKPWSTGALAGTVTVVNFWASWCPSCKEEWQALQDASAARPAVKFYAVDTMDRRADAEAFVNGHPSAFPVIFDERSVLQMSFTSVPNHALPFTVVLDSKGRIAAWKSGPTSAAMLQKVLDSGAV